MSMNSIASANEQDDSGIQAQVMADLIARASLYLSQIRQVNKQGFATKDIEFIKLENLLKQIKARDIATQQLIAAKDESLARLEERALSLDHQLNDAKVMLHSRLSSIPTLEAIKEAVQTALTNQVAKETLLALADPPPEHPAKYVPYSQVLTREPVEDTLSKRTLVVRGRDPTPGRQVESLLARERVSVPVKINSIEPRKNHVEITCNSEADMRQLQAELQSNRNINTKLNFLQKAAQQNKMILLGVPASLGTQDLTKIIADTYHLPATDIFIIRDLPHRTNNDQKDVLLVIPSSLGRAIIEDGGIVLGLKTCRLRPHTTIVRCRNCQRFGHSMKACRATTPTCARCGGSHAGENCSGPAKCINCTRHNHQYETNFDIRHQASDAGCRTYREAYNRERDRLDHFFNLRQRGPLLRDSPPPHHLQFHPEPPPQFLHPHEGWLDRQRNPPFQERYTRDLLDREGIQTLQSSYSYPSKFS